MSRPKRRILGSRKLMAEKVHRCYAFENKGCSGRTHSRDQFQSMIGSAERYKMISDRHRRRIGVCLLAMMPLAAFADRTFWGCGYGKPQILRSGQIACRQEVRQCTKMILSCSRGAEPLFTVEDFADYVAASDDGQTIVGLSNRGSENAFWIRNSHGKVIERKTHVPGPHYWRGIHYCRESVTNVREWFDAKVPDVRFQFKDGKLVQVVVRGCDGRDLYLVK